ncbi:MAG: hypothetical protein ACYDCM_12675 [Candidatus Acidiferrales bacterium]
MKSSPSAGVTASAVVLILIGAMAAFVGVGVLAGFVTLKAGGASAVSSIPEVVATGAAMLVVAGWGIATGTGLLRRRGWAWTSMLILSALLALATFPSLAAEPRLIRAITGIPTVGALTAFIATQFGLLLLAVAVWWIVYFTRKSVRAQFGFTAAPSAAPPKS